MRRPAVAARLPGGICPATEQSSAVRCVCYQHAGTAPAVLQLMADVQAMAAEIQAAGGIVTAKDLVDAQPIIKEPLRSQVTH